jgi:hypothetical protein
VLALAPGQPRVGHPEFAALCQRRAGPAPGSFVVANGMVIEQQQILTTQNLAVLVSACAAKDELISSAAALVTGCARAMVRMLGQIPAKSRARLRLGKDVAYACRQLLFFASLRPRAKFAGMVDDVAAVFAESDSVAGKLLQHVLIGLRQVATGKPIEVAAAPATPQRLLAWSAGPHWLFRDLPAARER